GRLPCGPGQGAPCSRVVVPGGRLPGPPEASGYEPPPQDATPRSAFRMSPETPLNERGCECPSMNSLRSQECSWGVVTPSAGPTALRSRDRESGIPAKSSTRVPGPTDAARLTPPESAKQPTARSTRAASALDL